MLSNIIGFTIVALVYLCLIVLVFTPTIYAGWMYLAGRKLTTKRKGITKLFLYVFLINLVVAYFLFHLGFDYFLSAKSSQREALLASTIQKAITSQQNYFSQKGRYYAVGPVRGPYKDEYGLQVEKDVILYVNPMWDKDLGRESFQAYAIHTWGNEPVEAVINGQMKKFPPDSEEFVRIRSKLLNSAK